MENSRLSERFAILRSVRSPLTASDLDALLTRRSSVYDRVTLWWAACIAVLLCTAVGLHYVPLLSSSKAIAESLALKSNTYGQIAYGVQETDPQAVNPSLHDHQAARSYRGPYDSKQTGRSMFFDVTDIQRGLGRTSVGRTLSHSPALKDDPANEQSILHSNEAVLACNEAVLPTNRVLLRCEAALPPADAGHNRVVNNPLAPIMLDLDNSNQPFVFGVSSHVTSPGEFELTAGYALSSHLLLDARAGLLSYTAAPTTINITFHDTTINYGGAEYNSKLGEVSAGYTKSTHVSVALGSRLFLNPVGEQWNFYGGGALGVAGTHTTASLSAGTQLLVLYPLWLDVSYEWRVVAGVRPLQAVRAGVDWQW